MEQLLDIKCIPIKLEFETHPMKFEVSYKKDIKLEIEREKGGLEIESNILKKDIIEISKGPHKINLCSVKSNAVNLVPTYLKNGMLKSESDKRSAGITEPLIDSEMSNDLNELVMKYKIDKIKFSCHKGELEVKFIPGSIEYFISQYPEVKIDYIGDMLYVPPSANPDYEEPTGEE